MYAAAVNQYNYVDLGFVKTFLLTYRAYTSPKILLQKLIERYNVIRSRDKSINDFNTSRTKIQVFIPSVYIYRK